ADDGLVFLDYYPDADSDTFGDKNAAPESSCKSVDGKVTNNGDCDDNNAAVNPNGTEVCNGVDDDCDTAIDDGLEFLNYYPDVDQDTFGDKNAAPESSCKPVDGKVTNSTDCNDTNPSINPSAQEVCDAANMDEDCDTLADDDDPTTSEASMRSFYADIDLDGTGFCGAIVRACDLASGRTETCGDNCPSDPAKTQPGFCGCGTPEDANGDGLNDCTDIELVLDLPAASPRLGEPYRVRVRAVTSGPIVPMNGMQAALRFDPTRLELVAVPGVIADPVVPVSAGSPVPPLSSEINQTIRNTEGTLLYALTSADGSLMTTSTPLFDMLFTVKDGADLCSTDVPLVWFADPADPVSGAWPSIFVSPNYPGDGFEARLAAPLAVDLDDQAPVLTGVPESIELPADAGRTDGAFVAEPTVTASDNCTGSPAVMLLITYPNGVSANAWPASGMFPTGTTSLRWTTVDDTGNDVAADRSITVLPYQLLDFTIRMDCPQSAVASHAIRFQAAGATRVATLDFPAWNSGTPQFATGSIQLPVAAGYGCVEAKDVAATVDGVAYFSHAVTDTASPVVIGRRYAASFVLVEGDSNNDDNIDIQDFSLFVFDRSTAGNPTTTPEGRSNFNADAFVETADFSVINVNFFKRGQTCAAGVAGPAPLARISVKELRRRGEGHLAIADLNGDGWVDASDVALFMQQGAASGAVDGRPGRVERPASARW
ncbi:MAG: hypothetical protein RL325_2009, partial [Planctomycetota bacterium]